jgi:hypothetical protein
MIQPTDLTSIDVIQNLIFLPEDYINNEEIESFESMIKNQYINFNNLGVNFMNNLPQSYKLEIYGNMIEYVSDNYLSIIDFDSSAILPEKLLYVGDKIYQLLCIDCYNTILPNFLNRIDCNSIESFDLAIRLKYKNNYNLIKVNILKTIKSVIEGLLKLQDIDLKIRDDELYKNLLHKYSYYIELIDFGDPERFVNNYLRPMLFKNFESIIWRIT